jgi:hypothetical protein
MNMKPVLSLQLDGGGLRISEEAVSVKMWRCALTRYSYSEFRPGIEALPDEDGST